MNEPVAIGILADKSRVITGEGPTMEELVARLDGPAPTARFALKRNLFLFKASKAASKLRNRGIKKLIKPSNADELSQYLPRDESERAHAIVRGDFVLCDVVPVVIAACPGGRCDVLAIATLGMSVKNAELLAELVRSNRVGKLSVVVSHYFEQVDKESTFMQVSKILRDVADLRVARSHAKVLLFSAAPSFFVFEGSANLRSSNNVEQLSIFNDRDLLEFHLDWMSEVEA